MTLIFRSVRKWPCFFALCLVLSGVGPCPQVIFADESSSANLLSSGRPHAMPAVVVSATRWEIPASEAASTIETISRKDIEALPAANVGEVLQYYPGIHIETGSGPGSPANPRIQGADVRHITVYVDGIPLNALSNSFVNLTNLPIDSVERIEVYKGAASSAWGSALGGVINIITRKADPDRPVSGYINTGYGEFSTSKTEAGLNGTIQRTGYVATVTRNQSDGFIPYSDYEQTAVYLKCYQELGDKSRIGGIYSYTKGRTSDPLPSFPDMWDDVNEKRSYEQFFFEASPFDPIDLAIEAHHLQLNGTVEDVFIDGSGRALYLGAEEERWGGSIRSAWRVGGGHTVAAGFDGDWGEYRVYGDPETYRPGNWALYANDTFSHGPFTLQAGVRYDHNEDFGSQASPSAGGVYRFPWYNFIVRAQVARGFSAPPGNFLHAPAPFGNPDLKPEKAISYQLGTEIEPLSWLTFKTTLFRSDVTDLIDARFNGAFFELRNIGKVRRQGMEGVVSTDFPTGLRLSFGAAYVDVKNRITGETVENIPRLVLNSMISYVYRGMSHSLLGKYIDHNPDPVYEPGTKDKKFVFDYRFKALLPWKFSFAKINVFLNIYNLFNTNYQYSGFWIQPDRWVEGGLNISF